MNGVIHTPKHSHHAGDYRYQPERISSRGGFGEGRSGRFNPISVREWEKEWLRHFQGKMKENNDIIAWNLKKPLSGSKG
jgi:hypothetical protein